MISEQTLNRSVANEPTHGRAKPKQVVYLFGAGASHANAKWLHSGRSILTADLVPLMVPELQRLVKRKGAGLATLLSLINSLVGEQTTSVDIEHVVSFLLAAPSAQHRELGEALRLLFERTLRRELRLIESELNVIPSGLYAATIDLHQVKGFDETLKGILTLNYDQYIEDGVRRVFGNVPDLCIGVRSRKRKVAPMKLVKLHGSFGWQDAWPISVRTTVSKPLWIPPGINKSKQRYPFNLLWGAAQELLDCDLLRIVGCRISANDWDLISMIFAARYAQMRDVPFTIEVIDSVDCAERLKKEHPYLEVSSLFDIDDIGSRLVGEMLGRGPTSFDSLADADRDSLRTKRENWYQVWLKHKVELTFENLGSIETTSNLAKAFLEAN